MDRKIKAIGYALAAADTLRHHHKHSLQELSMPTSHEQ